MSFSIVCHECGHSLDEGEDMIHLFWLKRKNNNRCQGCGKKLSFRPRSIKVEDKELDKIWLTEKL
jgi:DNA-directed RNA polymerase subunit RPC12/RpoP